MTDSYLILVYLLGNNKKIFDYKTNHPNKIYNSGSEKIRL